MEKKENQKENERTDYKFLFRREKSRMWSGMKKQTKSYEN